MKLYGAMDLHSNNNVTVMTDENDQVVCQKRLANDLGLIGEQLSPYAIIDRRDRSRVASGAMTFSSASRSFRVSCSPLGWLHRVFESFVQTRAMS